MRNLLISILTVLSSLFGFQHQGASFAPGASSSLESTADGQESNSTLGEPAADEPVESARSSSSISPEASLPSTSTFPGNLSPNTASTTQIPDLFKKNSIVFDGGTSTDTSAPAIEYRLDNTYIKNIATGTTTPLLSPSVYGNWHKLLYSAEVMGTTLYAGIQTPTPDDNQFMSIDLWQSNENQETPLLLFKNVGWFSVSADGYVALTDGHSARTLTILNPEGSVAKTIDLNQAGFCIDENNNPFPVTGGNWSGHDLWLVCGPDQEGDTNVSYLEVNADTFRLTFNSQPPSDLGL